MTTTPTLYVCPRHPTVQVETHVPATVTCVRCGRTLKPAASVQGALFAPELTLEPVPQRRG